MLTSMPCKWQLCGCTYVSDCASFHFIHSGAGTGNISHSACNQNINKIPRRLHTCREQNSKWQIIINIVRIFSSLVFFSSSVPFSFSSFFFFFFFFRAKRFAFRMAFYTFAFYKSHLRNSNCQMTP